MVEDQFSLSSLTPEELRIADQFTDKISLAIRAHWNGDDSLVIVITDDRYLPPRSLAELRKRFTVDGAWSSIQIFPPRLGSNAQKNLVHVRLMK